MTDDEGRIDAIATRWSLIRRPDVGGAASIAEARRLLVLRYASATRRYVGAIVRDAEEADELSQEVLMRLMRGDFAGADPERGRFRDLLKAAIRNMVRNHWAKASRRKGEAADLDALADGSAEAEDRAWTAAWQRAVLGHTWARVEEDERRAAAGGKAHSAMDALRLRVEHPDASTEELAALLGRKWQTDVRPDNARQLLSRARRRFAEYLVDEVKSGLADESPERLQEELAALQLLEWVGDAGR